MARWPRAQQRQPLQRYLTAARWPGCNPKTLTVHPGGVQLAGAPSRSNRAASSPPRQCGQCPAARENRRGRAAQPRSGRGFFLIAGNDSTIYKSAVYGNLAMQQPSWTSQKCARRGRAACTVLPPTAAAAAAAESHPNATPLWLRSPLRTDQLLSQDAPASSARVSALCRDSQLSRAVWLAPGTAVRG